MNVMVDISLSYLEKNSSVDIHAMKELGQISETMSMN
jgi:hypothetical protein